jgi:hypothetical protein
MPDDALFQGDPLDPLEMPTAFLAPDTFNQLPADEQLNLWRWCRAVTNWNQRAALRKAMTLGLAGTELNNARRDDQLITNWFDRRRYNSEIDALTEATVTPAIDPARVLDLANQNRQAKQDIETSQVAADLVRTATDLANAARLGSSVQPASVKPLAMQTFRGALRIRSDRIVTTTVHAATPPRGRVGTMDNVPAPPAAPVVTQIPGDNHLTKLAKLFPAEVLAIYPAGKQLLTGADLSTFWFIIGCVIAIILVRGVATMPRSDAGPAQHLAVTVSVVSFILWILAIGDLQLWWVETKAQSQAIAGAFAALWTWVTPAFVKGD